MEERIPSSRFSNLIDQIEPYVPFLVAVFYFLCNKDFIGLQYNTDEFGYLSKMIFLSGHDIVYPSQWRFGYALLLLPVTWLTRTQSQFWFNLVVYQSLIWWATFVLLRRFITFIQPDISKVHRFFILLICALYPSWCVLTGYAFASTVTIFLYMAIISLLCRWNGKSFWEPAACAAVLGLFYWVHPISLAAFIPLIAVFILRGNGDKKRCILQVIMAVAIFAVFLVLYKVFSQAIDKQMSDSISAPEHYQVKRPEAIDLIVGLCMYFGHISTLGLTTLGAGFCGLVAACHQMLSIFFKKIKSPLPDRVACISLFCGLSTLAAAVESMMYFAYLHPNMLFHSYYHWFYCRYLEIFTLPLLVLCFLVKWRKLYFLLPCVILLPVYYGTRSYVSMIQDNLINTISFASKNFFEYFALLKGDLKQIVLIHLLSGFAVIFLFGLFARFRKIKVVFFIVFACFGIIGICHGLRRHDAALTPARSYYQFLLGVEKSGTENEVTWDSFLHRNKKHINHFEYTHFSYPRLTFWKSKWSFDETQDWLKHKRGILITDFPFPLLQHSDLFVYKLPNWPYKYIASKNKLPGCDACLQESYWEQGKRINADNLLFRYSYPLNVSVFKPNKTGLYFSAHPKTAYLSLRLSQPTSAPFFLNGKKLTLVNGHYGLEKLFLVSGVIRQYNLLTIGGEDMPNVVFSGIQSVKLEDHPSYDFIFTRFSAPGKLYLSKKEDAAACSSNTLVVPANQTQSGPHIPVPPGTWEVTVFGKNLQQGAFDISFSHDETSVCRNIDNAKVSSDFVRYAFSHEQQLGVFDFRCRNNGKANIQIDCIALSPVRETDKSQAAITKIPFTDTVSIQPDKPVSFARIDSPLVCSGFYSLESQGRWAGYRASIGFKLFELPQQPVRLVFTLFPNGKQPFLVKNDKGVLLQKSDIPANGVLILPLDRQYFEKYGKDVTLIFDFPSACQPNAADSRFLSCHFKTLEVQNVGGLLTVGRKIDFNKTNAFFESGFSNREQWGTWSNAKNSKIRFSLPDNRKSETVQLRFKCHAYAKMHTAKIYCNGQYAGTWKINRRDAQFYDLTLSVPLSQRDVELRFEQFDLASPHDINKSNDYRQLGLGFISMEYLR